MPSPSQYKQGRSKPVNVKTPKKPSQTKPSRSNGRRRCSMPSTSQEAVKSDVINSVPVQEIEQAEKTRLRKASVASYTMEQKQQIDKVINAFSNKPSPPSSPSSNNKPTIERHYSINDHGVINNMSTPIEDRNDKIEIENEQENGNILLYDDVDESILQSEEAPMTVRNRKTINMIKSLDPRNGEGESNEEVGRTSRPKTRENRSVMDTAQLRNQTVLVEDKMGLIFRLRRMVPPGRHCYVFSVGLDFENEGEEGANTVIDCYQPHNLTTSALQPENITFARSQGVSLPKHVNTLYMFKNDLLNHGNSTSHGRKDIPSALLLASKLSHPINPKPRQRFMPTLGSRKKLWNRMESVLFKQWTNHQTKYLMECFHADWKQSSIYALLMGVSSDENERFEIMSGLKEHYALLKVSCKILLSVYCML